MRGVLAGALRFPRGGGRAPARAALGGDPATRAAAPVERAPLASDLRRVIPWAVSLKIVFNGQEYDSVDAMPPDVRKEYDVALETLRKSGGEEILSVLQRDMGVSGTHIKATFREIVVNGKKYDSVDAMPPDVRRRGVAHSVLDRRGCSGSLVAAPSRVS